MTAPTLLLAVSGSASSLWTFAKRDEPHCPLGDQATCAWRDASYALSRSLPLAWGPIRDHTERVPVVRPLALRARAGYVAERSYVLDGASLGLAFALEQAARVLGLERPPDLAASAAVDAWGAVTRIDGLAEKVAVLADSAPCVRRLLVAGDQEEGLDEARVRGLRVISVARVADALQEAFGPLEDALVSASDGATRGTRVEAFYRLALSERSRMVDWTPVAKAAATLLDAWDDELEPAERHLLRFSVAVARRHQGGRVSLDLPDESWLLAQPSPLRQRHVAQVVQHAADTGTPPADEARELGMRHVPERSSDRFPVHLEILGALARLDAVTGRFEAALSGQLGLTRELLARGRVASTTFQLSEAFRLAGALDDGASFDEASRLLQEAERLGDLDAGAGRVYVELAMGRAEVLLGREAVAERRLAGLCDAHGVPSHVVAAAIRWRAASQPGDDGWRTRLEVLASHSARNAHNARRVELLITVDDAARSVRPEQARAAIDALIGLEPEPLTRLLDARDVGRWPSEADYVRRFYPY